jgi:hypothetical protein
MASLLDLADARLRGLLDSRKVERPSMTGLLGNAQPQGTLAGAIQGFTPTPMQAMSNQAVMDYARNVANTARQNMAQQMSDLDKALVMDQGGINVGDRQAFARLLEQIPGLMGATAYHGTPHTIRGKFDISKVGTGEGNQSFGYGMYFAENPAVAEGYKNALAGKEQDIINNAIERLVYINNKDTTKIADALRLEGFNVEKITPELESSIKKIVQATDPTTNTVSKTGINEYANLSKLVPKQGNLYKVDIPDEYIPNMLDWDKPFSKQTKSVQDAIRKIEPKIKQINPDINVERLTGEQIYRAYQQYRGNQPDFASEGLNELGIKGIRYLDQGSRNPGFSSLTPTQLQARIDSLQESIKSGGGNQAKMKEQLKGLQNEMDSYKNMTSNFVVFDPSTVKILERNNRKIEGLLD